VSRRAGRGRGGGRSSGRLVGGLHPVRELLRAGGAVDRVLVAASREPSEVLDDLLALAADRRIPVEEVERDRLDERAQGLVHQGVVALAPPFAYADLDTVVEAAERPLLVALDQVTDPHNLGSIARTAEAVGAHGLVLPARRTSPVTPAAEKAAAGALAHLPVVQVTNLVRTLRVLGERGVWSVGLDAEAELDLADSRLLGESLVLVVGAEGRGLARLTAEACDQLVRLPMRGRVGSLNASVAAGVALFEILRRRG
jgi:23S rRNA (guanosine2251-2'-O)-methyltransferase